MYPYQLYRYFVYGIYSVISGSFMIYCFMKASVTFTPILSFCVYGLGAQTGFVCLWIGLSLILSKPKPLEPEVEDPDPPDIEELDPGIRKVVQFLWKWGFHTVDSGDGVSKEQDENTISVPHVAIVTAKENLITETDRLRDLLESRGITVYPMPQDPESPLVSISAQYDSIDETPTILLSGLNDQMVEKWSN